MTINWTDYHRLTDNNVGTYAPSDSGVYRISVEQKDGKLRVVYVGQAKNLNERLSQYLNEDTDNRCLLNHLRNHNCYFKLAKIAYSSDRDAAERALYDHFKPECNDPDKIPDVEPADINFD